METIKLSNEAIDLVAEKAIAFYQSKGVDKKETTRCRLIIEEVLYKYQEKFGPDCEVSVNFSKILAQVRCTIKLVGEAYNPFEITDEVSGHILNSLLDYEGGTPNWTYRNGTNDVFISTKRKSQTGLFTQIVVALVIGLLLGILAKNFISADALAVLTGDYLQPLANTYTGLLCVMAVLLTFFAIPLGIRSAGDAASIGQLSGKVFLRMYGVTAAFVLIFSVIFAFRTNITATTSIAPAGKALYDIFLGLFPDGIVTPFLNFNSVQILIIGTMFGFSLLAMGEKGGKLLDIFDTANLAAILTNNYLNRFIPYYVGISAFNSFVNMNIGELIAVPQILVYVVIGIILLIIYYLLFMWFKYKAKPAAYLKKLLPTFIISISSGSFGAAFSTAIDAALGMGANPDFAGFVINIGGVVFKPAHSITFIVSSVVMASAFGIEISLPWLIFAALLSIILTVAVPNVPGASASAYALLFTQLALPHTALVLMISINAFLEFLLVAVNVFCLQSEILISTADELNI